VALAVLASAAVALPAATAGPKGRHGQAPPVLMRDDRDDEGGEYERNERWFYEQRAYPFGEIPPDARRKAWEQWRLVEARAATKSAPSRVWRSVGPAPTDSAIGAISPVSGRIRAVAVSPADPRVVLVGAAGGGIWRSADGGATFAPVSDDQVDLAVGAIAFAPSDPSVVYAAMGQEYLGSGVLKSTDAGQTWRRVSGDSLPTPGLASDVDVDPRDPNRVFVAQYAALSSDGPLVASGVYLSTDGGRSWSRTLTGLAKDVAVDPSDPQTVYASMKRVDEGGDRPPGVYRSADGGRTWSHAFLGPFEDDRLPAFSLAVSPAAPGRVVAFAAGVIGVLNAFRVAVSPDRGRTWQLAGGSGLVASEAAFLAASPSDAATLFVGFPGGDLFRTTDGGATWRCVTLGYCDGRFGRDDLTHVDQHAFAFSPSRVYLGNDGGLYGSADGGDTWQSLNRTLSLVTFRSVAVSPANPFLSIGGTQDNGTQRRENGSEAWSEMITGDGGGVVFDPLDPGTLFTTYIYGTVFRWRDDGTYYDGSVADNATFGEPQSSARIYFYPPFVGDGATGRLYFGTWRLFTSDDRGETWRAPAGQLDLTRGDRDVLTAIGVARSDPNVIYTGSSEGRVMATSDAGLTWRDVSAGLPDRFVTSLTVDRANPGVAYVTLSGFRSGHVFKTTNAGATWADVSGLLPDIPANALLQDPLDPNTIYLGTDIGVFRSTSAGAAWEGFNAGMPPAYVLGFGSHPSGAVQAATYGRGAYELAEGTPPEPAYALAFAPGAVEVSRGGKAEVTLAVQRRDGFAEPVTILAPSTRALGLKVKPGRTASTGTSVRVTVKAKASARPGSYDLAFSARSSSGVLRAATLTVTVR
jgi:photosystem II stability/assembly factor-like uncharacterized protein